MICNCICSAAQLENDQGEITGCDRTNWENIGRIRLVFVWKKSCFYQSEIFSSVCLCYLISESVIVIAQIGHFRFLERRRVTLSITSHRPEMNVDPSAPLIPSVPQQRRRRDNRTTTQKKIARASIILSAGLERLAFYSLAGNLTFFLASDHFKWQFPNPIIAALIFLGKSVDDLAS